jgi:hypothetical protein
MLGTRGFHVIKTLCSALLLAALLIGCSGTAVTPRAAGQTQSLDDWTARGLAPGSVAQHAYIGDGGAGAVFRYPVVNGRLAAQPDSALTGLDYQAGAVGIDGTIYVNGGKTPSAIAVYAPGASGNAKPIRTLETPTGSAVNGQMAVDSSGYLYVPVYRGPHRSQETVVYAPDAGGRARPVARVLQNAPSGMAVDETGNLYIANDNLSVYANPRTKPQLIRSICLQRSVNFGGLALTATQEYALRYWGKRPSILVFSQDADGCPAPVHNVIEVNPKFALWCIAVEGNDLYVTGSEPKMKNVPAIFQFDARRFGEHAPVNIVVGPPLQQPREIYFGP